MSRDCASPTPAASASPALVCGGAALVSALLALAVGRLVFDVGLPEQPWGHLVALLTCGRR
ncbi:hypothetical protein [Streptomyces griseoloalbus]|uniref:Uncharacterized protein n=1 Tax=Streptomyces griseoloalbus TaxID=67303 RepID=A0A7W8BPR3_9ACTN|nr:hypothetical protein [Streptomyces albaduncus]MBB5127341.1 hypothetical protein [Streptomyces albaduncus]